MVDYTLEDAEKRQVEHPDSFSIPDKTIREGLSQGDIVKLIFLTRRDDVVAERLWVEVIGRNKDKYTGRIDNEPEYLDSLKAGDLVTFEPRHVSSMWED